MSAVPVPMAAVVLAGGGARRLGGALKPALAVGGRPMLARVLDAVPSADPRIVVGPPALAPLLPPSVVLTLEEPPGGGPVAALAQAVRLLPAELASVAVLSADLPFLTSSVVSGLSEAVTGADVAVLLDGGGRPQWLCAVWRVAALRRRLAAVGPPSGVPMRDLVGDCVVRQVVAPGGAGPPAWFDCDTDSDLRRAEEWTVPNPKNTMPTLSEWTASVCTALGVPPEAVDRDLVLELARDTAHGVARPAAPLTAYLAGIAVGRGADPAEVTATIRALIPPAVADDSMQG